MTATVTGANYAIWSDTGLNRFDGDVIIGTTPALSGALRLGNNTGINVRNAANTTDMQLAAINSSNIVGIGDSNVAGIILQPGTGDIQWSKALVALGGGATPTFGTIGGSGPATAAQNTWMRALDSAGAAFWVPAWK